MPLSTTLTTTTITAGATFCRPHIVYAKWRGHITNQPLDDGRHSYTDYYDITICPELPLAVGLEIKILAVFESTTPYAPLGFNHITYPIQYDTYDPQVEGRIVQVHSVEGSTVEFVLENHIEDAVVSLAYVAMPYLPNVTAKLDIRRRVIKWLTDVRRGVIKWLTAKNRPSERLIHLESAVVRRVTEFSFSR